MSDENKVTETKQTFEDKYGKTLALISKGIFSSFPSDIRYKVVNDVTTVLALNAYTIQELIKSQKDGCIIIDGIPYSIDSYLAPQLVQDMLDASLAYWDELSLRTAEPIVYNTTLGDLKGYPEGTKPLTPTVFNDNWERLNSTKFKVNLVKLHRSRSVYADFKAMLAEEGSKVVFANSSGTISEEVVKLMGVNTIIDSKYLKTTDPVSDTEVQVWISNRFSGVHQSSTQSTTTQE